MRVLMLHGVGTGGLPVGSLRELLDFVTRHAEPVSLAEVGRRLKEPDRITGAIETIIDTYLSLRAGKEETFLAVYRRVGPAPFKEALYADEAKAA